MFGSTVEIETSSKQVPHARVPVSATVTPDVEITPEVIVLQKLGPPADSRVTIRTLEASRIIRLLLLTSQGYQTLTQGAVTAYLNDIPGLSHFCTFKNSSLVGAKRLEFELEILKEAGRIEARSAFVEIKGL